MFETFNAVVQDRELSVTVWDDGDWVLRDFRGEREALGEAWALPGLTESEPLTSGQKEWLAKLVIRCFLGSEATRMKNAEEEVRSA